MTPLRFSTPFGRRSAAFPRLSWHPVFRALALVLLAFARTGETLAQAAGSAADQATAQTGIETGPAMATGLRADGKIWVVVGVIAIILLGLLAYLVSLDRRIAKAEAQVDALPDA